MNYSRYVYIVLGDPRTNQNPAILAIGVLFFRFHNVVAGKIQQEHPEWSDEQVFQRARRVVVATLQVRLNLDGWNHHSKHLL
jgi:dual oxidase